MACQDSGNADVLSLLLQPPRLSSLFFGTKSQHSTDSMFYSKQPLPCVFCALPQIVPTSCVKTVAMWMYCLPWFNHPDYLRCFLAWKVNIHLTLCSTQSSLLFCLVVRQDCWKFDVLSLLLQSPSLSSLFFDMKSQHSTDSMFYSKQPLPRVFCALPPVSPTWCAKTVAMWMYCLYCFNHPDFLRCFLAWKVNFQLTLCSTPSSLFLASSVLFLQLYLHHTSRLWQCGCIVFMDSTTQTLFDVFWHVKSTFNWLYVLLPAASSSRLLCSSSNRAYIIRQDSGNVDVLSLLLQPPKLSSLFFGMKSQHSLTLCSTPSSLYLASSVLFLQSCLHHASRLWQCGCIVFIDSTTQTLFAVIWHEKSTFNWLYVLLQAASSSRLLCSSSNCAYIMRKDSNNVNLSLLLQPPKLSSLLFGMKSQHSTWLYVLLQAASSSRLLCSSFNCTYIIRQDSGNVDVLSLLIQSPRLSSLFFGMKSQHSTDSMFYSKQPLPRVFCALPPIVPTSCVKTLTMWICLYCFNHPNSLRCYLAWKVNIQHDSMFYSKQPLPRVFCALPPIVPTSYVKTLAMWMYCLHWFNHPDSLRCFLACKVNIQLTLCSTHFYSKQPLPRVFCALPPIVPTSCVKTLAMWMYCLHWFNHPDSLLCFLAWKVNIHWLYVLLISTPSSLFDSSSVLFLQLCLHHASRL